MTDKELIIIDGVDVSGCKHHRKCILPDNIGCEIDDFLCCDKPNCDYKQLVRKTQECEQIKEKYEALKLENKEGYEIVAELKHECEELKKANLHIDTNRQCKGKKLKRIEELISACEAGYTDEFIQKIYGIIQEPEPTINDYSITGRYRKALEEIESVTKINCEEICGRKLEDCNDFLCTSMNILNIINKAKGK